MYYSSYPIYNLNLQALANYMTLNWPLLTQFYALKKYVLQNEKIVHCCSGERSLVFQ